MVQVQGNTTDYLLDVRNGRIKQGLGIGCALDDHIRFKTSQLNIIWDTTMSANRTSYFGIF